MISERICEQVSAEAKLNGQTMNAEDWFLGRIQGASNFLIQSKTFFVRRGNGNLFFFFSEPETLNCR